MIKSNINLLLVSFFFTFCVMNVSAQHSVKDVLTHKVIVNQSDFTIVAYTKPVNGVSVHSDRQYYWFATHQIKSTQGGYSGKLLNGSYQEFYINKNLKEQGSLSKGLKAGVWKSWDEAGKLVADYSWSLGRKNGVYHKYDSLGKVMEIGKYRNDLLHGTQKTMLADSTKKVYYKNGKITQRKSIVPAFIRSFIKRIFK